MATITSAQAGFADVGSTWVGGVAPGASDDVVLAHSVTFRNNTTLAGMVINAGGVFIKGVDVIITMNGNITPQNNNRLQIDWLEGGGMEFGNGGFTFGTPSQYPGSIPFFRVRGTEAKPCFLRTATGGTNARMVGSSTYHGLIDVEWLNFTRIGGAGTDYALTSSFNSDGSLANSSLYRIINCTFDSCGQVRATGYGAHARCTVQNTRFINCLGTRAFFYEGNFPNSGGGTRLWDNVRADTRVNFNNPKDFLVTNSVLNGFETSSPADGDTGMTMQNCLILRENNGDPLIAGPLMENCYAYFYEGSHPNKHFFEIGNYNLIPEYNVEGCVFEADGSDSDGDTFILGTPGGATDIQVNIRDCLYLPNSAGNTSGTVISQLGNIRTVVDVKNVTAFVGDGGGVAVGETYTGREGTFSGIKDSIFYDTSARGYKVADSGTNDNVPDLVAAADADYNCGHNLLTGSNSKGYHNLEFSSGSPGANDVDVDPQFVDASRDFLAFDVAEGGDGDKDNAIARWYAGDYAVTDLVDWVKAGFVPTNQLLKNAASDGGDIGAVPVGDAPAGGGGSNRSILFQGAPIY
jgi:hypothetical protein